MISLKKTWEKFVTSNYEETKRLVDSRYFAFFYNVVQPGSATARQFTVDKTEQFGNYGRVFLNIGQYRIWIAMRRKDANTPWLLTLDEKPVLEELTVDWIKNDFGKVIYHTEQPISSKEKEDADRFIKKINELEKYFGYSIGVIDYYSSEPGESAVNIIGEKNIGAGNARFQVIKAVKRLDHFHELVHVFAMKIGFVGPFIDEGIATALGTELLIKNQKDCAEMKELLAKGIEFFIEGNNFMHYHTIEGKNVYGLAQITMQYWLRKFEITKIKEVLQRGVNDPSQVKEHIESVLEPISITNTSITNELSKLCVSLAK